MRGKETGRGDGPLSAAPLPLLDSAYWTFCVSGTFRISLGCWLEQQKQILTPLSTSLLERHGDSSLHESNRNLALGVGWGKKSRRLWLLIWPFSTPLSSDVARTSVYPGKSAQIANSCRGESDWLRLGQEAMPWDNASDPGIGVL